MKIIPEVAARVMGKNPQFVRIGLQRGLLPFGVAMQTDARNPRSRHNYYISPEKFMEYTGATVAEIEKAWVEYEEARAT